MKTQPGHQEVVCCGYYLILSRALNECDKCGKMYTINGQEAKQTHTPTPWKVKDNRITERFYIESWNKPVPTGCCEDIVIATFNCCEQAELAVRAVNAHEEMLTALKATLERAQKGYTPDKDLLAKAIAKGEGK